MKIAIKSLIAYEQFVGDFLQTNKDKMDKQLKYFYMKNAVILVTILLPLFSTFLWKMAFLAIFRMNKYKNMQDFRAFMHKILHNGAPSGTRTLGPLIKSQLLYQLS